LPPTRSGKEDVSENVASAVPPYEPVARTVNDDVPEAFGVPETTPPEDSESPNGTDDVAAYEIVPPPAEKLAEGSVAE
jgi:hypothetical protein